MEAHRRQAGARLRRPRQRRGVRSQRAAATAQGSGEYPGADFVF
jgi:hypothetical protein